jgi:hypothetical protein
LPPYWKYGIVLSDNGSRQAYAMDNYDIVYVAVLPPNVVETDQIRRVASTIDKDLYRTRLLLAGKIPKIIAHYSTLQAAELTVQSLRGLGITAIMCKDAELRKPSHSFRAHVLQFGQKEIMFRDKSGQFAKMQSIDAFLILPVRMETHEDTEVTRTRMKLNLPATLLTGGIPIRRRVTEKATGTSIHTERFVRVYDKKSSDSNVEIRQYDFDYSCLGPKIAPSSLANFSTLVARIRDAFPQAVFDDRLTGNFGIDLPSTTPWGKIDIICKLVYLFDQSSSSLD